MRVRDSIKGHGQVLDRVIVQVILYVFLLKKSTDCSKSMKFECSKTFPKMLDSKYLHYASPMSVYALICEMRLTASA